MSRNPLNERVPTDAVWAIVTGGHPIYWTRGFCRPVFERIYPGIEYHSSTDFYNLEALARHDLRKHYEQNKDFNVMDCQSDTQAIILYGNEMTVPVIRYSSGMEWKNWLGKLPQNELTPHSEAYTKMMLARQAISRSTLSNN